MQDELQAQEARAHTLLSAYETACKALGAVYIQMVLWHQIFANVVQRYAGLELMISQYKEVRKLFKSFLLPPKEIPPESDIATVFSIQPFDYGYESWSDKASDSTWLENYTVGAHLPNGSAIKSSVYPAPFPDFFWVNAPAVPDRRGYAEWMASGFRSDYPNSELAYRGWKNWSDRFVHRIKMLYEFYAKVCAIPWPGSDGELDPLED